MNKESTKERKKERNLSIKGKKREDKTKRKKERKIILF